MVESNPPKHTMNVNYFPIAGDEAVYVDYNMEMNHPELTQLMAASGEEVASSKGKFIICCFDKSGSMSGAPFKALKEGANMLADNIFSGDYFESVITLFFDDRCDFDESKTREEYALMLDSHQIRGGTSFYPVIKRINEFVDSRQVLDLTVIFFTDGQGSYDQ
jgi:uncharacterized protein with von Willebrand factor type A (vWA) domain